MQVTVQKQALEDALRVVRFAKSGGGGPGSLPILTCVRLQVEDGRLAVRCTDIDATAEVKIDVVETSEEGVAVIPAKTFFDLVRALPDGQVTLTREGNDVIITYNDSRTMLKGYSAEQFPELPAATTDVEFVVSSERFKEMFRGVSYAISNDRSRPVLTGVFFELKGDRFRMVTTDGHRLAYKEASVQAEGDAQVIVPGDGLEKAVSLLSGETIVLAIGKTYLKASTVDATVVLRLIAGVFPNYEIVIPKTFCAEATVDKGKLEDAMKRAILLADEIPMAHFVFQGDVLTVETGSPSGTLKENLAVEKVGEDISLIFNCAYLLDALKSVDEKAVLKLTSPLSAAIIVPAEKDNSLSLLLPARPKEEKKDEAAA